MIKKEKWKRVKGYEDYYMISSFGRVKRLAIKANSEDKRMIKEKILTVSKSGSSKYYQVQFYIDGKRIMKQPHRLVAENFIPNRKKLPCVDFIDGDDSNFHVDNLEWVPHAKAIQKYWDDKKHLDR